MLLLGRRRDLLGGNGSEHFAVLARLHLDDDLASREIFRHSLGVCELLRRDLVLVRLLQLELIFVSLRSFDTELLGEHIVAGIAVAYLDDLALFAE